MILTIDIGNTNTNVGVYEPEGTLVFVSALETHRNKTRDQWAIELMSVLRLYGQEAREITGAILCSVVPPVTSVMASAVAKITGVAPIILGPGVKTGLNIKTEIHTQLGADIVAAAVAALRKYTAPIILIGMGTATTISLISRKHAFEGCAIFPGVRIALEALSQRSAQLPHISIDKPASVIGKNTIDSMCAGVVYGNAGMLDSMIDRIEAETEPAATVVGTGGNARFILRYCRRYILYDANITLEGLYHIYTKNMDKNCKKS